MILVKVIDSLKLYNKEELDQINCILDKWGMRVKDYSKFTTNELIDQILEENEEYLWTELSRISKLTTTILKVHGQSHPELNKVFKLFHILKMEAELHLIKEETIFYPVVEEYLELKTKEDLDKVINQIVELESDHSNILDLLEKLKEVTNNYTIPDDGCPTYETSYNKLYDLDADLTHHINLEKDEFFPRLKN